MEYKGWEKRLVIAEEARKYTLRLFEKSKTSGGCTEAEIAAGGNTAEYPFGRVF